jgi:hypothetical protein
MFPSQNFQFEAHGLIIEDRGFLDVYPYANWNGKVCPTALFTLSRMPHLPIMSEHPNAS